MKLLIIVTFIRVQGDSNVLGQTKFPKKRQTSRTLSITQIV